MKRIRELIVRYREIIRYLIVGGLTTVVSLGTYYLCVLTFLDPKQALQLQLANIISWIAAVTFAYFTNRRFVFESKDQSMLQEAGRFFMARVGTLVMEMGFMWLFVTILQLNDKVMKLVVQVLIIIANYVLSKFLVFKKEKVEREGEESGE